MGIENSTLTSVVASSGIKHASPEQERARTERINNILSESSKSLRRSKILEKKKDGEDDSSKNLTVVSLSTVESPTNVSPNSSSSSYDHLPKPVHHVPPTPKVSFS